MSKEKKKTPVGAKPKKSRKKANPAAAVPANPEPSAPEAGTEAPAPAKKRRAAPGTRAARSKPAARPAVVATFEEISLRAYFIAERRRAEGRGGDETGDWLEAERQLAEESSPGTT